MDALYFEQYLINHLLSKNKYFGVQTYCSIQVQTKFIHIDLLINVFFYPI
jgi:hypothetical protein